MEVHIIVFNDGVDFRIEDVWFDESEAIQAAKDLGEKYMVWTFQTKDLPPQIHNGFTAIKEIVLSDYEIEE